EKELKGPARHTVWLGNNREVAVDDPDEVSLDFDPLSATTTKTEILTVTYETENWGDIKFIGAISDITSLNEADYDGGALANRNVNRRHGSWGRAAGEQESYELQWTSSFLDDRIDLTTGVTYFEEQSSYFDYSYGQDLRSEANRAALLAPPGTALAPAGGHGAQTDDDAMGAYAQGIWHITDETNLTLGLRASRDTKSAKVYGTTSQVAIAQLPNWDFNYYFNNPTGYYNRSIGQPLSIIDDSKDFS